MKNIKILTIIVVFSLISFGCASKQSPLNSTVQSNKPAIVVTAAELAKEYKENAESAGAKYDGKFVEVSGKVDEVYYRSFATVYLLAEPFRITCLILENKDEETKALKVKKGDDITVIGMGIGKPEGKEIVFNQCRVK